MGASDYETIPKPGLSPVNIPGRLMKGAMDDSLVVHGHAAGHVLNQFDLFLREQGYRQILWTPSHDQAANVLSPSTNFTPWITSLISS
jgi:hypothetical protein